MNWGTGVYHPLSKRVQYKFTTSLQISQRRHSKRRKSQTDAKRVKCSQMRRSGSTKRRSRNLQHRPIIKTSTSFDWYDNYEEVSLNIECFLEMNVTGVFFFPEEPQSYVRLDSVSHSMISCMSSYRAEELKTHQQQLWNRFFSVTCCVRMALHFIELGSHPDTSQNLHHFSKTRFETTAWDERLDLKRDRASCIQYRNLMRE